MMRKLSKHFSDYFVRNSSHFVQRVADKQLVIAPVIKRLAPGQEPLYQLMMFGADEATEGKPEYSIDLFCSQMLRVLSVDPMDSAPFDFRFSVPRSHSSSRLSIRRVQDQIQLETQLDSDRQAFKHSSLLSKAQLLSIQEYIRYSLPFAMGWYTAEDYNPLEDAELFKEGSARVESQSEEGEKWQREDRPPRQDRRDAQRLRQDPLQQDSNREEDAYQPQRRAFPRR